MSANSTGELGNSEVYDTLSVEDEEENQPVCSSWPFWSPAHCPKEGDDSDVDVVSAKILQEQGRQTWDRNVDDKSAFDDASLDYWKKTSGMY